MKSREDYYNEFLNLSDEEMIKQINKDKNTFNKQITRLSEKFGDSILLHKYDRRISKNMLKNLSGVDKWNLKRSLASDHANLRWKQENAKTYSTKGMDTFLRKTVQGSGITIQYMKRNGKRVAVYEFAGRELSKDEIEQFYTRFHELRDSGKLNSLAYGSYDIKEAMSLYMEEILNGNVSDEDMVKIMEEAQRKQEERERQEFEEAMKNQSINPSDSLF